MVKYFRENFKIFIFVFITRGASLFLVHKKVHLDYAVSDQTNRSYPNEPLTLYR